MWHTRRFPWRRMFLEVLRVAAQICAVMSVHINSNSVREHTTKNMFAKVFLQIGLL